ncbi:disease resistance protein RPS2-like [Phoenix dactylifera]|uniref:Disease resistance protein RPS2-like n=1 Tax=Phoenix dactylifera TaxID=42345 RepID=A0A8B8ZQZ1_PHODC|nr:disease resistance protein RPS2-like [Phoenix dactylifera]
MDILPLNRTPNTRTCEQRQSYPRSSLLPILLLSVRRSPNRATHKPPQHTTMATGEGRIEKVLSSLQDPNVGRIVLFSMNGGVGKTWTARHAMRRAMDTDLFDIFVWVTLSVDLNWRHAQRRIAENLFIPIPTNRADGDGGEIVSTIRNEIWRTLSEKRFLLVLDDAWLVEDEVLDLMGVPCPGPENLSKVMVTTRSTRTFVVMEPAEVFEPLALPAKESWSLFCDVAGEPFTSPAVHSVAQTVSGQCSGAPLLIILIAGALRNIKDASLLWDRLRQASSALRADAEQLTFQTMNRVVKFSYDALPSDLMKDCFLYCTLFSGARDINSEELIRYWVLEGFIDGYDYRQEAYKQGRVVLEELVNRGALYRETGDRVSMHDVVREVALEIARASGRTSYERAGTLLTAPPNECAWRNLMRISLMDNLLRKLPECPQCSNLSTLLLKGNQALTKIPNAFFDHMEKLRVLDLSYTGIRWLPASISKLLDLRVLLLRGCQSLQSVMELHALEKLEVLDLSCTSFIAGYSSLERMSQLRVLDLSETPVTSLHFLGNLANLRHLSLRRCHCIKSGLHLEVATVLEELDLSGTTLVEFPYEISKLTRLICADLSGTRYTRLNWEALQWLPENLNLDNCNVSDTPMELVRKDGVYVAVGNSDLLLSLEKNSQLWENCFRKFHFCVCPSERASLENDIRFQRKQFIFRDIYFESRHFAHPVEHTKYLEICGVDSYPKGIEGVLNNAELVSLNSNAFMKKLSDLGFENVNVMKECWIERCDQAEVVFRGDDVQVIAAIGRLENLWISNLANLRHLCEGMERLMSFSSLKHLHVDCCPNLVSVFSSALRLENLVTLQIKFCDKLESVFGESVAGQEMLPQLRTLRLWELPELKSICEGHLPSLKMMKVKECPQLKKLPLDAKDIRPLVEIRGERWWWNNLMWEDARIEDSLHFRNWGPF